MTSYCEERPVAEADQERTQVAIYGYPISHSVAPKLFDIIFPALGLPRFKYVTSDCADVSKEDASWRVDMAKPTTLGSCVTMPLKLTVRPYLDEITQGAETVGSVNTTYFRKQADGSVRHVGTNLDVAGVGNSLLSALSGQATPVPEGTPKQFASGVAAGLMIGGGGATRAAILAMSKLNVSPILLINRDAAETAATVKHFPQLDLRPLDSLASAEQVLQDINASGQTLCVGVGAIPSIAPQTEQEQLVYDIAEYLFKQPYKLPANGHTNGQNSQADLSLPLKSCFLEMAYKPPMTIMRKICENAGWKTICGVEVVLEGCFEQAYLWTGKTVDMETREKGRALLRSLAQ